MIRYALASICAVALVGCGPTMEGDGGDNGSNDTVINDRVRAACPTLSDEVLDAFVISIERLREESLPAKADALANWVDGCQAIPPDGNFGGDEQACATCMTALVEEIYD